VDDGVTPPQRELLDQNDVKLLIAGEGGATEEFRP
jgi:hypothetical protein